MKKPIIIFFLILIFIGIPIAFRQNNRLNTSNKIKWLNYFATFKVSEKIGVNTEYQWCRNNTITDLQLSLLRFSVYYNSNPDIAQILNTSTSK